MAESRLYKIAHSMAVESYGDTRNCFEHMRDRALSLGGFLFWDMTMQLLASANSNEHRQDY
jgi:hypothetical protein